MSDEKNCLDFYLRQTTRILEVNKNKQIYTSVNWIVKEPNFFHVGRNCTLYDGNKLILFLCLI